VSSGRRSDTHNNNNHGSNVDALARPPPPSSLRRRRRTAPAASASAAAAPAAPSVTASATPEEAEVLDALRRVIDPDFGADVVACGFVKRLRADRASGAVSFELELTTPACPVKEQFRREAQQHVGALAWVTGVEVRITAQAQRQGGGANSNGGNSSNSNSSDNGADASNVSGRPGGLRAVRHIVAVSSCKGGVGKSTTAVNLAYTLAQMGAKVGILDADVYGPSLPTMVSPDPPILRVDPETRALSPCDYLGVKLVSFGFAGQGSAIMRGAMVSGLVQQLLTTAEWGELDYLIIDFPPGTGDVQLTLCQACAITAAVVVTTPQKLAFVDVAKGVRMFARLAVPCAAVVENMAYFDGDDGKRYRPFGGGASGARVQRDFGIPHLVSMPIAPELSASGDGGVPLVVSDPTGGAAARYMELGAAVVREIARATADVGGAAGGGGGGARSGVSFDADRGLVRVAVPPSAARALGMVSSSSPPGGGGGGGQGEGGSPGAAAAAASVAATSDDSSGGSASNSGSGQPFWLEPAVVRASDASASALDEWTGAPRPSAAVADDGSPGPLPASIVPLGNYAVQISWDDGFNQVAPYEILEGLRGQAVSDAEAARRGGGGGGGDDRVAAAAGGVAAEARIGG